MKKTILENGKAIKLEFSEKPYNHNLQPFKNSFYSEGYFEFPDAKTAEVEYEKRELPLPVPEAQNGWVPGYRE